MSGLVAKIYGGGLISKTDKKHIFLTLRRKVQIANRPIAALEDVAVFMGMQGWTIMCTPGVENQANLPVCWFYLESALTRILHQNELEYAISRLKDSKTSEEIA